MNYRLGPLGFAASADLAVEAQGTQMNGNYDLVDQRNAMLWNG